MDELLLGTLFGRDREHILFRKGNLAPKSKSHSPTCSTPWHEACGLWTVLERRRLARVLPIGICTHQFGLDHMVCMINRRSMSTYEAMTVRTPFSILPSSQLMS